ncbi:hypothetical protein O3M35_011056 [Rhynocoris fuscipes]|uniref:Protein MMS22-like n=1 Tax=Rhynocoris fuscipes TaxID=488301 RepID=A0AAW1CWT7_9HEMI
MNSVRDSFQHFLRILGLYLLKTKDEPRHWRLIKARIFTKLSPSNIANLSQIGEYHFISLFLTLALTLGYGQVGNKMIELGTLAKSNSGGATSIEFIKGQLAFVLVILENGGNAENALKPVVEYVNRLSFLEHNDTLRLFAETVQDIFQSYDNLTLGQHVLIDIWMAKYLSSSTNSDSSKLLSAVLRVITRQKLLPTFQKPEQEFLLFIDKLWSQLEPYLGSTVVIPQISVPYEASDIAAALASQYLSTGKQEKFKNIFAIFLHNEISDIKLIRGFLCRFIDNFGMNEILPGYNKIIIKAWLRCCFLSAKHDDEIRELTTFISTLPDVKYLFEGSEETLASSDEPLLMFFMCLQNKFIRLEGIYEKQSLREKFLSYVDGMENWIKPVISHPRNHEQIKILFCAVGNMFRLIAPLLYIKSKPNTILQQLIDQLLLPFSVHNPETKVHENIISAVKLNLHLFIQGLMQLSPNEDHYILRTLKELITVYIPRCTNLSNNILLAQTSFSLIGEFRTFDNKLKTFILSTVCNSFLKRKSRRPTNQAIFGVTFIKEIMILHGKYESIFSDLITCTFERICDVIMYCETTHPVYKMAKDIIKLYLNSNALRINNAILDEVSGALTLLANENLAWSSRQMFDLLIFISLEAPDIVMNFLPKLQELIKEVELKRGVGFDRTLRSGYEKIEQTLNSLTKEMM